VAKMNPNQSSHCWKGLMNVEMITDPLVAILGVKPVGVHSRKNIYLLQILLIATNKFIDILTSLLINDRVNTFVNDQIEDLNSTLQNTLDTVAQLKTKEKRNKNLAPWYTDNNRALKQASRKLE
uniref:Uncharacterized protein n=1 Tax=Esox lucius TaxID=8010 RepID=A0AAY5K799_ESOLU